MKPIDRRIPAALTALVLAGQLCLPTAALSLSTAASPEGDVSITQAFPDCALQSWLMKQGNLGGMGADGVLTQQERLSVTHLDLSGLNLTNLAGLELFPNLQSLDCSNNQLTSLDLSGNPALEHVNCAFNRLTTLDLSQNQKLISLNCEMNLLTSLNLSGCGKLTALFARNNLLPSLELSDCSSLEYVELVDNRLTHIDLSSLSNLHFIHLTDNRLTSLDLSHNLKLLNGGFMAEYNQLTSVTLPNHSGLTVPLENFSQQNPQPGYSQVAWYLDPQGSAPASDSLTAEGQTLYSKPIANQYTIYFSANGGSGSNYTLSAPCDTTLTLTPNGFSRPGYTFSHWSTQPQKDATTYQNEQEVENLAGEKNNGERVTLYARWTPNQYTVVLNANGGTGDDVSLEATYGQSLTLTANSFEKDDKEFAGWSLTSNGPVRYPDNAQVQDLTTQSGGSVTLYAVWRTPLSEVQKPYLAELEQAFQSYSSGRSAQYTTEDWDTLSAAYDKGTVTAQVTLPQGVKRATLNIPAKVSPSTVAMVVKEDGSREILRKSLPTKDGLAVQVTGSCKIQLVDNSAAFADVAQDAWFSTAVQFTASRELFSGVGDNHFAPQDSMSRAMLVTVLYQLENRPQTANTGSFSDVAQDAWYHDAALWAQQQGITGGSGDGSFSPDASISRESLALMLYRSAQSLGVAGKEGQSLDSFADHSSVSPWAKQAMEWAYANGILSGNDNGQLAPQADSSRAEVSAMLSRFVELVTL